MRNLCPAECPEDKAAGARAKIYRGNRYDLNWSSKSPTITCKESGSATRRITADGVSTISQPTAHTRSWKLFRHRRSLRFFQLGDNGHSYCFFRAFSFHRSRHSRVGSSSGSGVSCLGRIASGTLPRLIRMRVHVDDLPRMESTRTSSGASKAAASAYLLLHLSRPASAAALSGEFATTMSGILTRGFFVVDFAAADFADFAREGATLAASPSILRKCGGQGASPKPAASSLAASSKSFSSEPGSESMSACGSPISAKRFGTVNTVKSAGSQSGTSCQSSGVETRASGSGRTEYAEQVVRSFAFWL